jgi:hypothetical protein
MGFGDEAVGMIRERQGREWGGMGCRREVGS